MYPVNNSSPKHQIQVPENGNVKVVIRIRPLNETETSEKHQTVTEAISDHMLVFDPKIQNAPGFLKTNQRDINRRRFKDLKYAFDYVFGPAASNKAVFEQTTKGIVNGVLNGYNCSVFAYGATGAGKTHTMLGNEREPGVIYHTMIDLYKKINEQKEEKMFDVAVSYSEVYNEQVRDLLMPRGNLPIREDKNVGVIIAGLSLHKPKTAEELLHMLQFGNKNRTQHPTDANAESSRSHAVFQVFVNQREKSANAATELKMAKMCLVDLAGSERANHTTNRGDRFREGANINRSLLALGNVINALADNKFKGHIPYRDSKLTRLLKDSLGGNCQTVMIAAVSPSSKSFEDTYNTLRYADRAKHIRADLKKNVINVDFHIANYKKYVQELEKENQELRKTKQKLMETIENGDSVKAPVISPIMRQFQERLKDLFKTRKEIRKTQMESEGAKRELKWKVIRKEQAIKRVGMLTASQSVISKHNRVIDRMKKRIAKEEQTLAESAHTIQDHDSCIYSTYSSIVSTLSEGKQLPELLDLNVRVHTVESNLYDSHMYLAFVKKMARAQERQASVNEKLISSLIQLVKKQHDVLHSQDLLNQELQNKYEQCCYLVEERGVAWDSPGSPQDGGGGNNKTGKDEEEEMCISEIIDIQIPKLHVQALRLDSVHQKPKADTLPQIRQQPQRILKPMSAVKPATRCQIGPGLGNNDRNVKGVHGSEEIATGSNQQTTKTPEMETKQSVKNCDLNPVEALNNSLEKCPKRLGQCGNMNSGSPHGTPSASVTTISFGDSTLVPTESVNGPKPPQAAANDQKPSLLPQNTEHDKAPVIKSAQVADGKVAPDPKPYHETPSQTSSTDHLNDTFQVLKPALPNTPCIDSSLKLNIPDAAKPSPATPHLRQTTEPNRPRHLEKIIKADTQSDDISNRSSVFKGEGVVKVAPALRFPPKSLNSTFSSSRGTEKDDKQQPNNRRISSEFSRQNKLKSSSAGSARPISVSPVSSSKHSPTNSSKSAAPANSNVSNPLKSGNLTEVQGSREKTRPVSACCMNANNVHSLSTSPKTYADVVKSPVVGQSKNSLSPQLSATVLSKNWVGEPMEGVLRTEALNPNIENLSSTLKMKNTLKMEPVSSKPGGDALDIRQPLKLIDTNALQIVLPKYNNSDKDFGYCVGSSSYENNSTKTQLKARPTSAKERRQKRALSSNPYSIHHRKTKPISLLDLPKEIIPSDSVEEKRPGYMLPTFARAQKMLGICVDRPAHREANNPLSRRTLTNRQPFTLAWNKITSNTSEVSWKC
ncbi:uncharacterized protein LOC131942219 isoform X2 [Physella acuta]|uniref:uncharacterized protein LOC131942219 isoform X2 n=1 Tax=Physella acuta TaxID=109671 RepID=UPI0027DBACBC|nr:uncharacterized protein LOC131942219 isoform X2 [Physella acuta]